MGLYARPSAEYWRPKEGEYKAQIVDIVDLGIVESNFEGRVSFPHKFILITELDVQESPTTLRHCVLEWLTLSTHEMSNLRAILEDILDRELTDQEYEDGYDIEKLLGTKLMVKVVDKASGIGPRRKVRSIIRRRQPTKKTFKSSYIRSDYLQKLADEADITPPADDELGF